MRRICRSVVPAVLPMCRKITVGSASERFDRKGFALALGEDVILAKDSIGSTTLSAAALGG